MTAQSFCFRWLARVVVGLTVASGSSMTLAATNATIVRAPTPLRESYPTYRSSTLFTFRLVPGPILTTIPEDTRVEVTSKKIVAKTQEWFEAKYVTRERTFEGWIYAGEVGDRKYLRLDKGVEDRLTGFSRKGSMPSRRAGDSVLSVFVPTAQAQNVELGNLPPAETDPVLTLLLGLAHVAIFIGSLVTTRKWVYPASEFFSFLTSLCVLLILGFISDAWFGDLLARLLAG